MIWPYIILSYATLFVFGLTDNVRGPLFPEILKQFEVSDSVGSLMFALSNISGLVASYGSRQLLRRFDRLSVLQAGAACLLLSLWGLAVSTHFYLFLFFSFFFGLSLGVLGLIPNILVPLGTDIHKRQQMLSGLHTMYGLASLAAPLLAATVANYFGSWRWTFFVASLAPLLLLAYTFHRSHKSLHFKSEFSLEAHKAKKLKNQKPQIYISFLLSFAVATEIMFSSRLALYMQRVHNFDLTSSSLYVTYFFMFLMASRFLFTLVPFKKSPQFWLGASLIGTLCLGLAGLYLHPLFLAAVGFAIAPFYPLTMTWIANEFPDDLDSAVTYIMAIDSIMLILMHVGIGKLTDAYNINTALLAGLTLTAISFFMIASYNYFFKKGAHVNYLNWDL